jgi:hypothetical protein
MTSPSSVVSPSEALGRGIFDSRKAKNARRGTILPGVFRERSGIHQLSVDRLSFGCHEEISSVHDMERPGQKFHGWAVISAESASQSGRTVVARPIEPQNPYHAEIVLPDMTGLDADEEQDQHALNLAMMAKWLSRPTSDNS